MSRTHLVPSSPDPVRRIERRASLAADLVDAARRQRAAIEDRDHEQLQRILTRRSALLEELLRLESDRDGAGDEPASIPPEARDRAAALARAARDDLEEVQRRDEEDRARLRAALEAIGREIDGADRGRAAQAVYRRAAGPDAAVRGPRYTDRRG